MVSWQARDVTERSPIKYKACPRSREARYHQDLLYGQPGGDWGRTAIIVEGATDAWRIGEQACAIFGIEYTQAQVMAVARQFDQAILLFDPEPQAQAQAAKLAARLRALFIRVDVIQLDRDPGDYNDREIKDLIFPFTY